MSLGKKFLLIMAAALLGCAAIFSFAELNINHVLVRPLVVESWGVDGADIGVVLGAGLNPNGSLSTIAGERVGHALSVYQQSKLPLMFSGGETPFGIEAVAMNEYAQFHGYAGSNHMEASSRSTYENAFYSDRLLDEGRVEEKVLLVITSPYHSRRALATFKKVMPEREVRISYPAQSVILQDDILSRWKGLYAISREYAANAWYRLRYGVK